MGGAEPRGELPFRPTAQLQGPNFHGQLRSRRNRPHSRKADRRNASKRRLGPVDPGSRRKSCGKAAHHRHVRNQTRRSARKGDERKLDGSQRVQDCQLMVEAFHFATVRHRHYRCTKRRYGDGRAQSISGDCRHGTAGAMAGNSAPRN